MTLTLEAMLAAAKKSPTVSGIPAAATGKNRQGQNSTASASSAAQEATPRVGDILTALRDPRHSGHLNCAAGNEIERLRSMTRISNVTEEQINHMVDRFLSWKLPRNFSPDGGISFKNLHPDLPHEWPSGTNLIDYTQAKEMVRHMIADLPAAQKTDGNLAGCGDAWIKYSTEVLMYHAGDKAKSENEWDRLQEAFDAGWSAALSKINEGRK